MYEFLLVTQTALLLLFRDDFLFFVFASLKKQEKETIT